ncbi:MAG: hypothetical protein ACRD0N_04410 [Acidimicrobiales bacterium]
MSDTGPRRPEDLDGEAAERLRRAHLRLRKASQDLEGFTAPPHQRGRWAPAPVPDEAIDAARAELAAAYQNVWTAYRELLGWEAPDRS